MHWNLSGGRGLRKWGVKRARTILRWRIVSAERPRRGQGEREVRQADHAPGTRAGADRARPGGGAGACPMQGIGRGASRTKMCACCVYKCFPQAAFRAMVEWEMPRYEENGIWWTRACKNSLKEQ